MNMVNGYILYRLMVDSNSNKNAQPRRHSLMPISEGQMPYSLQAPRSSFAEPFCSPLAPHVPIRQRLSASGQQGSGDICNETDSALTAGSNLYLCRRRRMSLLQTLRYQNRQLADSGVECHVEQSDRDSEMATTHRFFTQRPSYSPPFSPVGHKDSRRGSSITKFKNKTFAFFGKRPSRKSQAGEERVSSDGSAKYSHNSEHEQPIYSSIDLSAKEARQGKSPSTNDSGRGSQGRIGTDEEHQDENTDGQCSEQRETVAIIERSLEFRYRSVPEPLGSNNENNLMRSLSCPQLGLNLRIYHEISRRAMSTRKEHTLVGGIESGDGESDEMFLPITEEPLSADKEAEGTNEDATPTRSVQSNSTEAEYVVEEEDIKFAEKVHRDEILFEGQDNAYKKEAQVKAVPQKQQREQQAQWVEKMRQMSLSNGYVAGQFVYAPPILRSHVAQQNLKGEKGQEEQEENGMKSPEHEMLLQSGLEKVAIGYDIASSTSSYSDDGEEDEDNLSSLMLDHYLPIADFPHDKNGGQRSSSLSSLITHPDADDASPFEKQRNGKVGIVTQTDLSLVHISDQLSSYLSGLTLASNIQDTPFFTPQGMNFLAKHFFEYQSFNNLPHVAVQLHKPLPSQAGADQSAAWAPKSMMKAGKNQAAPGARANRNNVEVKPGMHRYGRAAKHEFREWGDKHGELKAERIAPHKDALTKFLSNEENTRRNVFECEFEERILQTEPETLPERLSRTDKTGDIGLTFSCAGPAGPVDAKCSTEVLTILTYAPQVQFVTATVKKAKSLPYNNKPFARVMLFERRRLLEQKQTTVTPATSCNGPFTPDCGQQRSSTPNSSSSSSSAGHPSAMRALRSMDVIFSESFLFHITPQMLDRCHIVIEMFDSDPTDCGCGPVPIGHCVIGPMCPGTGCVHWLQMIRKTGLPVCMWHRLKS